MSRYIDAEWLLNRYRGVQFRDGMTEGVVRFLVEANIRNAPSIDIVRCQDCKHWVYNFNGCARNPCTEPWYATDFCNYGEREGE